MRLAFQARDPVYDDRMGEEGQHILLTIDTAGPLSLDDFVAVFVGIGNQFERFTASDPDEAPAQFFVKEVRAGSIIAELIAFAAGPTVGAALTGIKHANDVAKFVETFGARLKPYFKRGGRDPAATKGDLADFHRTVVAIANDPEARMKMEAAVYEDGERQIRSAFKFSTAEAREAERQIAEHRAELDQPSAADHTRVLMSFIKTDKRAAKPGKRSGELVMIERISPRALPIVYASDLAERRIKHEIADGPENIYKRVFDVDVNVESKGGREIAYRVVAVHDVFDLPEDNDAPEFGPL